MPGPLGDQARIPTATWHLAPEESGHPLLAKFRPLRGTIPWEAFPVYRYWQFATLATGTQTIIPYSNGQPALVEKPLGKGRVVTMTTPCVRASDGAAGDRWNLLPTGFEPWPFVMLSNELALYLVGGTESQLNYLAGQTAVLPLDEHERHPTYQVVTPRDQFLQSPDNRKAMRSSSPRPRRPAITGSRPEARRASIAVSASTCRFGHVDWTASPKPNSKNVRRLQDSAWHASATRSNAKSAPIA